MDPRPTVAGLASHLVGAALGALAGTFAGVASGFHFAPDAAVYLCAVNVPMFAGPGLMLGLLSPQWALGARMRLILAISAVALASACESVPAVHFINGQLVAEMARDGR